MNKPASVLGCAGLCWVGFSRSAQANTAPFVALRSLCRVCWVNAGACVRTNVIEGMKAAFIFFLRKAKKPSTPSTLSTKAFKVLICKGFECAGFVLSWAVCVLGSVFEEVGHD